MSSPVAGPSSRTLHQHEAEPLPPKAPIWPLGLDGIPSRSSSQRSLAAATSSSSRPSNAAPTAAEAEARLDARLADVPLPPQPSATAEQQRQGRRNFVPRSLRTAAAALPRLPHRTAPAPPPPPAAGAPSLPGAAPASVPERGHKPPASRLERVLPHIMLWILSAGLLAGTGVGYSVAIRMNNRQMAMDAAQAQQQQQQQSNPNDPNANANGDGGGPNSNDPTSALSSVAFLHTFFLLALAFEIVFLYRRTRMLYIAWFWDPFFWFAPEAVSTSPSRRRPSSHLRVDNPTQTSEEIKNSVARKWIRRALEYALRVRPEQLRPRDEVLPTYVAALEVPSGWDEQPGTRGRLTREERRLARTGSARGTGDVEDIEVERAWRLGGGRGPPTYGGDEVRQSVILLSSFPTDPAPATPATPASFTRLSRRVSDSFGRLSRRLSARLGGTAPSTPNPSQSNSSPNIGSSAPEASPKLAVGEKANYDEAPSPLRHAHHASVILDLAHEFECEKEAFEEERREESRRSSMVAGPSGAAQYANYTPRTSIVSSGDSNPALALASPRRTSWTLAHHRRRSSNSNPSLNLNGGQVPPSPGLNSSRLATVHENAGRPSADGGEHEHDQEVVV